MSKLIATLAFTLIAIAHVAAADLDREQLLSRAAPGWEMYREFVKRLQGSVTLTVHSLNDISTTRTEVRWSAACASHVEMPFSATGGEVYKSVAHIANSRYGFRLQRAFPETAWTLANLIPASQVSNMRDFPPAWGIMHCVFEDAIQLSHVLDRLPDFCASPSFRLLKMAEEMKDGELLLRIEFSSTPGFVNDEIVAGVPQKGYRAIRSGHFYLDPKACYTIRIFDLEGQEPAFPRFHYSGRIDYRMSADGYPILVKKVTESRVPVEGGERIMNRTIREYDLKEEPPPKESAFTLTAFGLPEPARYRAPTPWYWYLAIIGLVVLIVGVILRRRWKRNS